MVKFTFDISVNEPTEDMPGEDRYWLVQSDLEGSPLQDLLMVEEMCGDTAMLGAARELADELTDFILEKSKANRWKITVEEVFD